MENALREGIFDSKYCLLGNGIKADMHSEILIELQTAVAEKKTIITVDCFYFPPTDEDQLPEEWKPFQDYIYIIHEIVYAANFVDECAALIAERCK